MDGKDSSNNEACIINIRCLEPKEILTFIITNNVYKTLRPEEKHHVVISLLGFKDDPSEMLVGDDEVYVLFPSYEYFKVKRISMLLNNK